MTEVKPEYAADPAPVEPAAAAQKEEGIEPAGVLKLRRPVTFEGKIHTEIPYDFGKVTRADLRRAARTKERSGGFFINVCVDIEVQEVVFVRAAGIPVEILDVMDVRDYNEALGLAAAFFA